MRETKSAGAESYTAHFYDTFDSPVGILYLVFSGKLLKRIDFTKPEIIRIGKAPPVLKKELRAYFEKGSHEFTQKTDFSGGTEFEIMVWLALKEVPYGETRSYKWLAEKIGRPKSSRAVGQALGKNPIPIIFPCHRIVESDGSLGGYSGGIDIKRRLLEMEYYLKQEKER